MSLPAVLNEVISVTGTYPFPFTESPSTIPTDPPVSVIPNQLGPVLVFGNALTIGGTATTSTTGHHDHHEQHRRCRGQRPHVHRG